MAAPYYGGIDIDQRNVPLSYSTGGLNAAGNIQNMWAAVFGPKSTGDNDAEQKDKYRTMYDMPEAYKEQNILADVVVGLAKANGDWTFTLALPLVYTEEVRFRWKTETFDQVLAELTPHETTSHVQMSASSETEVSSKRHGLAAEFEMDFLTTAAGAKMFVRRMLQIKYSIIRTLIASVMNAIVSASDGLREYERDFGTVATSRTEKISREVRDFAEYVKTFNGIEQCDARVFKDAMELRNITPNMYIVGPELKPLAHLMFPERMFYKYTGMWGVTRWMQGPRSIGSICGTLAFEAPIYNPYDRADQIQALESNFTVGEYYTMTDNLIDADQRRRSSMQRAIRIYHERADVAEEITMMEALKFCGRFDSDGELHPAHEQLLGSNPDADDMFFYVDQTGNKRIAHYWGQVEDIYVDDRCAANVMTSASSQLTHEDMDAIRALMSKFHELRALPIRNELRTEALIFNAFGSGSYANVMSKLREWACAYSTGKDLTGTAIPAVDMANAKNGGMLASWAGLEAISQYDERVRRGIQAFAKLHSYLYSAFGGSDNPMLDEAHCPAHLVEYIEPNNRGACTLFERVVADGTVPLYMTKSENALRMPFGSWQSSADAIAKKLREQFELDNLDPRQYTRGVDTIETLFAITSALQRFEFKYLTEKREAMYHLLAAMNVDRTNVDAMDTALRQAIFADLCIRLPGFFVALAQNSAKIDEFANDLMKTFPDSEFNGNLHAALNYINDASPQDFTDIYDKFVGFVFALDEKYADFVNDAARVAQNKAAAAAALAVGAPGHAAAVDAANRANEFYNNLMSYTRMNLMSHFTTNQAVYAYIGELIKELNSNAPRNYARAPTLLAPAVAGGPPNTVPTFQIPVVNPAGGPPNYLPPVPATVAAYPGGAPFAAGATVPSRTFAFSGAGANPAAVGDQMFTGALPFVLTETNYRMNINPDVLYVANPESCFLSPIKLAEAMQLGGGTLWGHVMHRMPQSAWRKRVREFEQTSSSTAIVVSSSGRLLPRIATRASEARKARAVRPDSDIPSQASIGDPAVFMNNEHFAERWNRMVEMRDPIDRACYGAFVFTRVNFKSMASMIQCNFLCIPYGFLILRPFITHTMGTVYLMVAGQETGFTAYGHGHMAGAMSVQHKTYFFHFTFYCGSFVKKPDNIICLPGKYYKKYIGGCNVHFIADDVADRIAHEGFLPPTNDDQPSMYSVLLPYTWTDRLFARDIDIRGYYDSDAVTGTFQQTEPTDNAHYPNWQYENHRRKFGRISAQPYGMRGVRRFSNFANSLCLRGWQQFRDINNNWEERLGLGHHGGESPVGRAAIRSGSLQTIRATSLQYAPA